MYASFNEHAEIVRYLLKKGAKTNHADTHGENALHYAAIHNSKGIDTIELLLKDSTSETINKKTTDITKNTPLDWAYHNDSPNKTDIIDLIRQYGGMHGSEKSRKKANNKARKTKKKKKMYISLPDDEESKNYSKVNEKLSNQSKKINMVREPEEFPAELLPPPGSFFNPIRFNLIV